MAAHVVTAAMRHGDDELITHGCAQAQGAAYFKGAREEIPLPTWAGAAETGGSSEPATVRTASA
jgi:hypothetical protein